MAARSPLRPRRALRMPRAKPPPTHAMVAAMWMNLRVPYAVSIAALQVMRSAASWTISGDEQNRDPNAQPRRVPAVSRSQWPTGRQSRLGGRDLASNTCQDRLGVLARDEETHR